jgi:hypothetical protein
MNSQLGPTFISSSAQQIYGGIQPAMPGTNWHMQNGGLAPAPTNPTSGIVEHYSSTAYSYPNYNSQKISTSRPSNISTSTSTSGSHPTNLVDRYQASAAWATESTAGGNSPAITNNTSCPEDIYSASSTDENDTAAQLDWMVMAANNDARYVDTFYIA